MTSQGLAVEEDTGAYPSATNITTALALIKLSDRMTGGLGSRQGSSSSVNMVEEEEMVEEWEGEGIEERYSKGTGVTAILATP